MSQVVVTKDSHLALRKRSLGEEQSIQKERFTEKWKKSDATRTLSIERVFALIFFPVVFSWLFIGGIFLLSFAFVLLLFLGLGKILPK